MPARDLWLGFPLLLLAGSVPAEEMSPSMELLEFLGEWENENGEWVDPEELAATTLPDESERDEERSDD